MFKLESYVTPYILGYLGKYFKNFDPADFQMSLWSGGAVFQNLNLDLNVLDQELNLPLTFVSGHIHDMKIIVPWTKVTSDAIQVNINTIEVTVKLRSLDDAPVQVDKVKPSPSMKQSECEENPPPPGYMQNLITKILNNVHVCFENVIVKYIEDDIVLSLNIKKASYWTVDEDWNCSFIDLIAPDFILRKKFQFQDLTVCLDQRNTAGKIETYQEPLLYRCAFEVRIFQQFKTALSKTAYFTRMDLHADEMVFSVTDEQVPMALRLYILIRSLFQIDLNDVPIKCSKSRTNLQGVPSVPEATAEETTQEEGGGGGGESLSWGSWAVSWLPPISAILGDEIEYGDGSGNCDDDTDTTFMCHYGLYINKLTVTFKALERTCDPSKYGRSVKVKFLPFLKCHLQGIVADIVLRGDESNYIFGVSQIIVNPEGFCPCGIVDGVGDGEPQPLKNTIVHYLDVGRVNLGYSKGSMFTVDCSEGRPEYNYDFKYDGHVESFTEEAMLERTPAIALEFLQTHVPPTPEPTYIDEGDDTVTSNNCDDILDLSKDKFLTRLVVAPCTISVSSGMMHRLKLINYAMESYPYEPYGEINKLMGRALRVKDRSYPGPLDLSLYRNFESAYDVYQLTIIQPKVEVWAADHPEYDFESREKHLHKKRRIRTTIPFSQVLTNWPKLVFVFNCVDVRMLEPNLKYRALVAKAVADSNVEVSKLPRHMLVPYKSSMEAKAYGFEIRLEADKYVSSIVFPTNFTYVQKLVSRTDLQMEMQDPVSEKFICTDAMVIQLSWIEANLCHLIMVSMAQSVERFSELLTTTTLLQDLPRDKGNKMAITLLDISFKEVRTMSTCSSRASLRKCGMHLEGEKIIERLPVLVAPTLRFEKEDSWLAVIVIQYPLESKQKEPIIDTEAEPTPNKKSLPPVFLVHIAPYNLIYTKEILTWMNYSPNAMPVTIPHSVLIGKDLKVPLRALSHPSSRDGSKKSFGSASAKPSDGKSCSGNPNVPCPCHGPTTQAPMVYESTKESSGGGGSTKSSLQGYQLPFSKREKDCNETNSVSGWEQWLASNLGVIKSAIVQINIGQGDIWFPLRCTRVVGYGDGPDDSILLTMPKIKSRSGGGGEIDCNNADLPLIFNTETLGQNRDIFPLTLTLDDMFFNTVQDDIGHVLCCEKLSWVVTLSLSTRSLPGKASVTTACIHTDIISVHVTLAYSQVMICIKLMEQLLHAAGLFHFSGLLIPPPVESDLDHCETGDLPNTLTDSKPEQSNKIPFESNSTNSNIPHSLDDMSLPESMEQMPDPDLSTSKSDLNLNVDESQNLSLPDVKATCWIQLTIGNFTLEVCGLNHTEDGYPLDKLVLEVEDIVSSLDIQSVFVKWIHKVANVRLLNFERQYCAGAGSVLDSAGSVEAGSGCEAEGACAGSDSAAEDADATSGSGAGSVGGSDAGFVTASGSDAGSVGTRASASTLSPTAKNNYWKPGQTLGIIFSSGDEITRDISPHVTTFNKPKGPSQGMSFNPRSSLPMASTSQTSGGGVAGGSPGQKMRGCLSMTFTRVQSSNYHTKLGLGLPSPMTRWTTSVYKFTDKDYSKYIPLDDGSARYLSEIDIKIKAMDFVLNPSVFRPYVPIIDRILEVVAAEEVESEESVDSKSIPDAEEDVGCIIPALNSNTLPLIYLETEAIRLFLKGDMKDTRSRYKANVPDFILFECSAINLASHNENPLNRTIVKPFLFQIAEKARILSYPGSPVEDRQYQVEINGFTAHTGFWKDVSQRSNKLILRSSKLLKTQGENPALEWNIRTVDMTSEDVSTFPLIDRMEFTIGFAPAIVYERSPGNVCRSHVVAGHAFELNLVSDVKVNLNVDQLDSITQFGSQINDILIPLLNRTKPDAKSKPKSRCRSSSLHDNNATSNVNLVTSEGRNCEEHGQTSVTSSKEDSGIDSNSIVHLPPTCLPPFYGKFSSGKGPKKGIEVDQGHKHNRDMVPVDFLLACGMINVTIYDMQWNLVHEVEKVIPLVYIMVTQPHLVMSVAEHSQKLEVSVYELNVRMGSVAVASLWIPSIDQFDISLFDSIPGARDPKTGMIYPLLNLKITDFIGRPCSISCDVQRPTRLEISQIKLDTMIYLADLLFNRGSTPLQKKSGKLKIVTTTTDKIEKNRAHQAAVKGLLGKVGSAKLSWNQLVVSLVVKPAEITWSCAAGGVTAQVKNHRRIKEAESLAATFGLKSLTASTKLNDRSSPLVTPLNVNFEVKSVWAAWLDYPTLTVTVSMDPVSLYFGPHNILCVQQVHHVLSNYLDEMTLIEEEIIEIMELPEPTEVKVICDSYEDDLRAGSFKFCRLPTSFDLPQVYQIAFCEAHRTMTWRYPQQRVLTSIEASPVPMDNDRSSLQKTTLDCVVEHWDDAMCEFIHYGSFTLSETCGASVGMPNKDKLHSYNSSIWRIKILTPLEEADSRHLVRPEILAACLKIDSIHDCSLVSKLKVFLEVPRITVNLVNNFYHAGRGPSRHVPQYSNNSLSQFDQTFGEITFELSSMLLSVWAKHLTIDSSFFLEFDVLDYEFMTLIPVVEPSLFKASLCLFEKDKSTEINSELEIIWKRLTMKVGATAVHTIMASVAAWTQVLGAWKKDGLDMESIKNMESINVNQIVVLNTLPCDTKLYQKSGVDGSISVPSGACVPFYWLTHKHKAACKLGIKEKEWAYTCSFELRKQGYIVRSIKKKPIFIKLDKFAGMQRLVTITGSLCVGNGLSDNVEVAVLPNNKSQEIIWKVQSKDYGPSQMIDLGEIEHIRFRLCDGRNADKAQPWSNVVMPEDMKEKLKTNSSVCICLFEELDGKLTTYCVWCTLLEEKVEEALRYLIVLSPCFRIQSFLPSSTQVHVATARLSSKAEYSLEGKGEELEIAFKESRTTTHHLTFQSNPKVLSSTPSIPLLPDGPTLTLSSGSRSIDDILSGISQSSVGECVGKKREKELRWPFVTGDIPHSEWVGCSQPDTDLEVEFTPWIEGLPTILLQLRPWAILINLSGAELHFSQSSEPESAGTWRNYSLPNKAVFSPSRMSLHTGRVAFGLVLNNMAVHSQPLRFSEEQRRTDIHHCNTDNVIPIDAFSRLDIVAKDHIAYLTIEARLKLKMLVITVRPTYSVINKTGEKIYVQSVAVSSSKQQTRGKWDEEKFADHYTIDPVSTGKTEAYPLHRFYSGCDIDEYASHLKSVKYLALSCGGPWWFAKMMDFSVVFDNMNCTQGVLAAAVSVNIPKYGVNYNKSNSLLLEDSELEAVTMPVVLSWTCRDGQVWIQISPDDCPQLVLHNTTAVPFLYVQAAGSDMELVPFQETDYFEQYHVLPSNCRSHYTFVRKFQNEGLPQIFEPGKHLPNLLLTKLPQDLKDFIVNSDGTAKAPASRESCNSVWSEEAESGTELKKKSDDSFPHGTLLMPGIGLKWSKLLNIDGEASQYFCVGEFVDAKITIEKVGFTYYIFIENMSSIEVAAKDVRRRIGSQNQSPVGGGTGGVVAQRSESTPELLPATAASSSTSVISISSSTSLNEYDTPLTAELKAIPEDSIVSEYRCRKKAEKGQKQPLGFRCFLPTFAFIVTEDLISLSERRPLFSLFCEDLYFEQVPKYDKKHYRALFDRSAGKFSMRDSWALSLRIGDVQIDSPGFPSERTCDFPVVLRQEESYTNFTLPENCGRSTLLKFYESLKTANCMIAGDIIYGQSTKDYRCLERVKVQTRPFFLNVEDRLLDFVFPSIQNIHDIAQEQITISRELRHHFVQKRNEGELLEQKAMMIKDMMEWKPPAPGPFRRNRDIEVDSVDSDESIGPMFKPGRLRDYASTNDSGSQRRSKSAGPVIMHPRGFGTKPKPPPEPPMPQGRLSNWSRLGIPLPGLQTQPPPTTAMSIEAPSVPFQPEFISSIAILSDSIPNIPITDEQTSGEDSFHSLPSTARSTISTTTDYTTVSRSTKTGGSEFLRIHMIRIPSEVEQMLDNFSHPVLIDSLIINQLEICLTLRLAKLVYLAMDHSRLKIPNFEVYSGVTTSYRLGQALSAHYTTGAIFQIGNPMRLIGSLELLGSPGSLVESVGTGLKDFVVYPYQGMFQGPTGFVAGLGNGVTSLLKSVTSGALTSVTNWAWSVSRNIDKLTLDEEEQILTEGARRVQLEGFTDGFIQGLTGFGIRLLGAVGGIAHHPIQNVIQNGASPVQVLQGVSRGMVGIVTRPIGGLVELVAMTGQGVLRSAGWTPQFKTKGEMVVEEVWGNPNSMFKYQIVLKGNDESERFLLLLDASQQTRRSGNAPGHFKHVSLLLSTENLYVIDVTEDLMISHFPVSFLAMEMDEDRNLIRLKTAPPTKKDDMSYAKERIIDFVRGNPNGNAGPGIDLGQSPHTTFAHGQNSQNEMLSVPSDSVVDVRSTSALESSKASNYRSAPSSPKEYKGSHTSTHMYTAVSGSAQSLESTSSSVYPLYFAKHRAQGEEGKLIGEFIVSPHDKSEFENVLSWVKMNEDEQFFTI